MILEPRNTNSIYVLAVLILFFGCQRKPEVVSGKDAPKKQIKDDSLNSKPETTISELSKTDSLDKPLRGDTIVYFIQSPEKELEYYRQLLKVVELTDSTVWFKIEYQTVTSRGICEGIGQDRYSHLGLEVDEYEGRAYLAKEYSLEKDDFYYALRIKVDDLSLARFETASNIPTDAIPLDWVMPRISNMTYKKILNKTTKF